MAGRMGVLKLDHWDALPAREPMRPHGLRADPSKNRSKFGKSSSSLPRLWQAVREAGPSVEKAATMYEKRMGRVLQLSGIRLEQETVTKGHARPVDIERYETSLRSRAENETRDLVGESLDDLRAYVRGMLLSERFPHATFARVDSLDEAERFVAELDHRAPQEGPVSFVEHHWEHVGDHDDE